MRPACPGVFSWLHICERVKIADRPHWKPSSLSQRHESLQGCTALNWYSGLELAATSAEVVVCRSFQELVDSAKPPYFTVHMTLKSAQPLIRLKATWSTFWQQAQMLMKITKPLMTSVAISMVHTWACLSAWLCQHGSVNCLQPDNF